MKNKKNIKNFILNLFFTRRCKFCQQVVDIREEICDSCKNELNIIENDICFYCGAEKSVCGCKEKKHYYLSICAPYYYDGAPKKAIAQLKFRNKPYLAEVFAEDMAECFKKHYGEMDFDLCTFVPAYKGALKKRGYNQSQLLACALSEKTGVPFDELLEKPFETPPQHTLDEVARKGNLLGSIHFNEKCARDISGMRILLCDDIKTTGATLDECAKTLLINGAAEVRCITFCTTKASKNDDDYKRKNRN